MPGRRLVLVPLVVFGVNAVFLLAGPGGEHRQAWPWGWALQVVSAGALLLRHRWPGAVLVVTAGAALLYYPFGFPDSPLGAGFVIALFTVTRAGRRLAAAGGVLLLFAGVPLMAWLIYGDARLIQPAEAVGQVAILLGPVVAGESVRAWRERAEAAVRERETQERLRIARELHDVLAHQISLISVQAGAALHRRDPDGAFEALEHIRAASKQALREFRTVLGVLRDDAPRVSLARLPELLAEVRAAGVDVRLTGEPPRDLPAAVDAAAFRIVQESLSNVLRHAGARTVRIDIHEAGGRLALRVDDDGAGGVPAAPGNGLRGMRERVETLGGTVEAGRGPEGGFRVRAELPRAVPA
ncbi:sensor histidine kinase [Actinoplanes awajinensis]|uniref:histidine kinase n=1 Tax=Actinoplanes awajinensis subsp. mycoplanecinus TaxID=135947 RepID=A0A117MRL8_9ACTN|nr:sensor histidine kinase [Actinoplanes awajinensis]KUL31989.1 hypothetical protein ADL15_21025 [Actinoplanes awajinensis subsp. mycoplanecinus]